MKREDYDKIEIPLACKMTKRDPRVHIGLVLLSTDHSLESEWLNLLGPDAIAFTSRMPYSGKLDKESLLELKNHITTASDLIATGLEMDVLAFGCTSASLIIGNEEVADCLNRNRLKHLPTTNPWISSLKALENIQCEKLAVFAPYPSSINFPLVQGFEKSGFKVTTVGSLGIEQDIDISHVSIESIIQGIEKMLSKKTADALFLSCTNLRVLSHLKDLEKKFGLPIITSNQALYWHALQLAKK